MSPKVDRPLSLYNEVSSFDHIVGIVMTSSRLGGLQLINVNKLTDGAMEGIYVFFNILFDEIMKPSLGERHPIAHMHKSELLASAATEGSAT